MADTKSRKNTGEHSAVIVKLMADGAAMREQLDSLEARILLLEAELSNMRKAAAAAAKAVRVSMPPAAPSRASKRPGPGAGPPPLPRMTGSMNAVKAGGRRSFVDISDIAELVESMPPPPSRGKK